MTDYHQLLINFIWYLAEFIGNISAALFCSHVFLGWPKAYKPKQNVIEEADKTWDKVGTFIEKSAEIAERVGLLKKEEEDIPKLELKKKSNKE